MRCSNTQHIVSRSQLEDWEKWAFWGVEKGRANHHAKIFLKTKDKKRVKFALNPFKNLKLKY
jgi:hypothetical protein